MTKKGAQKKGTTRPAKKQPVKRPAKVSRTASTKTPSGVRKVQPQQKVGRAAVAGAPTEEIQAQLAGLQDRLGDLQESLLLTEIHNETEEIETTLAMLPAEIEELRTRGYVFRNFLENKVDVLAGQWQEMRDRVLAEVSERARDLEREADAAANVLTAAAGGQPAQVARAEARIDGLEREVSAALSAARAMFQTLQDNANQTRFQIEQIRWLVDQVDEASFRLYPAEDPVAACRAQHMETEKEGPEGNLYLTDERLLFEQKEEVATKKVLFITTAKETVQQLLFEVPVGQIAEVKTSQKGLFGRKEILELQFTPEADLSGAVLRLRGADNEEWAGLIGRVLSGDIASERTRPKEEAAVEAAREAPTKCPTCGALLTTTVVRGMREINCEYCGAVIRL